METRPRILVSSDTPFDVIEQALREAGFRVERGFPDDLGDAVRREAAVVVFPCVGPDAKPGAPTVVSWRAGASIAGLAASLTPNRALSELIDLSGARVCELLGAQRCGVMLWDPDTATYRLHSPVIGFSGEPPAGLSWTSQDLRRRAATHQLEPEVWPRVAAYGQPPDDLVSELGAQRLALAWLSGRGEPVGALLAADAGGASGFTPEAIETLRVLAAVVARALRFRQQMSEALRNADDDRRRLLTMPVGLVSLSADGRITYVNEAIEQLLGCARGEMLGRPWPRYVSGGRQLQSLTASESPGEPAAESYSALLIAPDDQTVSVNVTERVLIEDGHTSGFVLCISEAEPTQQGDLTLWRLRASTLVLQRVVTAAGVLRAVTEELRKLGLASVLVRLDGGNGSGNVLVHNADATVTRRVEGLLGQPASVLQSAAIDALSVKREVEDWSPPVRLLPSVRAIEHFFPEPFRTHEAELAELVGSPYTVVAPIRVDATPLAILMIAHKADSLSAADSESIQLFTGTIGAALERARLIEAERSARGLADRLRESALLLNTSLELKVVLDRFLEELAEVIRFTSASVQLLRGDETTLIAAKGLGEGWQDLRLPLADYPQIRELFDTGRPHLVSDTRLDNKWRFTTHGADIRSNVVVPLLQRDRVIGLLSIDHREVAQYSQADVELALVFARHAAVAIENARLFEELGRTRDYLDMVVQLTPDALIVADEQGRVVTWNRGAEDLYGWPARDAIGRPLSDFEPDDALWIDSWAEASKSRRPVRFETRVTHRNGDKILVGVSLSVLTDNSHPRLTISLARDMTERERLQKQLVLAEKLSALGQLVSGVAHELNNPLTSVLGMSQLLQLGDLSDSALRDVQTIQREAERAARIVANLVAFAGKRGTHRTLLDVNQLLKDTLRLTVFQLQGERTRVVERFAEGLPSFYGDAQQLQQVFLHVMHNASQAMHDGHNGGTLTITTQATDKAIRIEFADDGPGISSTNLPRVFDPFFTTRDVGKGTGMGLSVAYGIVAEHEGEIWAESELGKGTTFVIELPLRIAGNGKEAGARNPTTGSTEAPTTIG